MKEFPCTCTGLNPRCIGCQANTAIQEAALAERKRVTVALNQMILHRLVMVSDTLGNPTLFIEQAEGKFFCVGTISRREWHRRICELTEVRTSSPQNVIVADPSQAVDPSAIELEARIIGDLERAIRGQDGIWPDWVYEARAAIKRRNEDTPWLGELLDAVEWPADQTPSLQAALNIVRRMVAVLKAREVEKGLVRGLGADLGVVR